MNAVVFVGPTVPPDLAGEILDARYLPPAAQGDVYQAALSRPRTIGIVDGYFQGAPAVWHKEILWAMNQGIQVYGSASMGALRAAELAAFGMRGVGRIFQAYRDGSIMDDDEVALIHGPAESDYLPLSEPLVNMRFTLEKAQAAGVLDRESSDLLIGEIKALFYWDRDYPTLLQRASQLLSESSHRELSAWLERERLDQKREDALEMFRQMADSPDTPFVPEYRFEQTSSWDSFVSAVAGNAFIDGADEISGILTELRLDQVLYRKIRHQAVMRLLLADNGSDVQGEATPSDSRINAISPLASDEMIGKLAIDNAVVQQLKRNGEFDSLKQRAEKKRRFLFSQYGGLPEFGDLMLTPEQVVHRYLEDHCQRHVPSDLEAYAKERGFQNSGAFCHALLHELVYQDGVNIT